MKTACSYVSRKGSKIFLNNAMTTIQNEIFLKTEKKKL